MSDLTLAVAVFIASIVICELLLRGTKLQTALIPVLAVHALCWIALLILLVWRRQTGAIAVTIFWAGAFVSWFGIRSHIESSILLRMLYLLRQHPTTANELISRYQSHWGEKLRVEELVRAGLLDHSSNRIALTRKGDLILRIVDLLK
jgi:hypothetical protein